MAILNVYVYIFFLIGKNLKLQISIYFLLTTVEKKQELFFSVCGWANEARLSEQKYSDRGGNKCLLIPSLLHLAL